MNPLIPVILSGGAGTRLWPLSRQSQPKPFLELPDGETLLQKTLQRALALPGVTRFLTVTRSMTPGLSRRWGVPAGI